MKFLPPPSKYVNESELFEAGFTHDVSFKNESVSLDIYQNPLIEGSGRWQIIVKNIKETTMPILFVLSCIWEQNKAYVKAIDKAGKLKVCKKGE